MSRSAAASVTSPPTTHRPAAVSVPSADFPLSFRPGRHRTCRPRELPEPGLKVRPRGRRLGWCRAHLRRRRVTQSRNGTPDLPRSANAGRECSRRRCAAVTLPSPSQCSHRHRQRHRHHQRQRHLRPSPPSRLCCQAVGAGLPFRAATNADAAEAHIWRTGACRPNRCGLPGTVPARCNSDATGVTGRPV